MATDVTRPLQVLVVEDSPEYALIVRQWLEEGDLARVTLAEDAPQARAVMGAHDWDLVITDVEMPGDSGLDLIQEVKAAHKWACVLVMTGVVSAEYGRTALQNDADGMLFKPFAKEVFLEHVRKPAAQQRERGRQPVQVTPQFHLLVVRDALPHPWKQRLRGRGERLHDQRDQRRISQQPGRLFKVEVAVRLQRLPRAVRAAPRR